MKFEITRTVQWVREFINEHKEELSGMNLQEIKKIHPTFYYAAYRRFGAVNKAFIDSNTSYLNMKIRLTDQELIDKIKEHYTNEDTMETAFPYFQLAGYRFGGIEKALSQLGIDHKKLLYEKRKNDVLKEVFEISKVEDNLRTRIIKEKYSSTYYKAWRIFGRWENAVHEAGLSDKLKPLGVSFTEIGLEFQRIVKRVLTEFLDLNIEENVQRENGCAPDFSNDSGLWIDAKITVDFSGYQGKQMKKYSKYAKHILIITLVGNDNPFKNNKIKVENIFDLMNENKYLNWNTEKIELKRLLKKYTKLKENVS